MKLDTNIENGGMETATIIPFAPIDKGYSYANNVGAKAGDIVMIEFGRQKILGYVESVSTLSASSNATSMVEVGANTGTFNLKKIDSICINNAITSELFSFLKFFSHYNLTTIGETLKAAIPATCAIPLKRVSKKKDDLAKDGKGDGGDFVLNEPQRDALSNLLKFQDGFGVSVLKGVTGSGKTFVYISYIKELLKKCSDGQVLIMVPEIALTGNLIETLSRNLQSCTLWHSSVSVSSRRVNFNKIITGEARIVISTRSGLMLPYKKLALIIVDEEHDQSYKQEDGVCYQARDMAIARCKMQNIPALLCSATPSIETYVNCVNGKYNLTTINARFNSEDFPLITLLNMKNEPRIAGGKNFITQALATKLTENFSKGSQSLLFINRRGYSPTVICTKCGIRMMCKRCDIGLNWHKSQNKLKCHYCNYSVPMPEVCPSCKDSQSFAIFSPGVEKIEEEVRKILPDARILVLTSDTFKSNSKQGLEPKSCLQDIKDGKYDIVIGTQIIAKGHTFPLLKLVGIIDADAGTANFSTDIRSHEKTFQLLVQVAGRAGRHGKEPGEVVMQTFNPDHPVLKAISNFDIDGFYEEEAKWRHDSCLPPFSRQVSITVSCTDQNLAKDAVSNIGKALHVESSGLSSNALSGVIILGPAVAPIKLLRGRYRFKILLQAAKKVNVQNFIVNSMLKVKISSKVRVKIDIDPYDFL